MTKESINRELDKLISIGYSLTVYEQNDKVIIFKGDKFESESEEWIKIEIKLKTPVL